ncbi:MAG: transketolase C-terminal domain-containing protein, partial [Pseudomonadota bacterium]
SGGTQPTPMVLMTSVGGGYGDAGQHSQCLYATFGHLPGMKVVIPSNAHDAKGMMTAAIRDPNPVIFMCHKNLQGMGWLGTVAGSIVHVPEESFTVPLGKANVAREGSDLTIVGLGATVHMALAAAAILDDTGTSCEVIDLRSVVPLDRETVINSVKKTGRLLVVDDDYKSYGVAAEVICSAVESASDALKTRPQRIAHPDVPIPFSRPMEQFALPNHNKIVEAATHMMQES